MNTKVCRICRVEKENKKFPIGRMNKLGVMTRKSRCYKCKEAGRKEYLKNYRLEHKEYFKKKKEEWNDRNIEKIKAHRKFHEFKRKEKISPQSCVVCEKTGEAHHVDYSNPLLILWVCKEHHEEIHSKDLDIKQIVNKLTSY